MADRKEFVVDVKNVHGCGGRHLTWFGVFFALIAATSGITFLTVTRGTDAATKAAEAVELRTDAAAAAAVENKIGQAVIKQQYAEMKELLLEVRRDVKDLQREQLRARTGLLTPRAEGATP